MMSARFLGFLIPPTPIRILNTDLLSVRHKLANPSPLSLSANIICTWPLTMDRAKCIQSGGQ